MKNVLNVEKWDIGPRIVKVLLRKTTQIQISI
jgi:hypothetical protein